MTFPAGAEAEVAERGEAELERWRAGLREDLEFATQPRFCYSHEWRDPPTHTHTHTRTTTTTTTPLIILFDRSLLQAPWMGRHTAHRRFADAQGNQ